MTSNIDRYGKRGLEALLSEFGTATPDKKTTAEPHEIDLYFQPGPKVSSAPLTLGLLGELIQQPTVLEPFSTRPSLERLAGCLLKLYSIWAELRTADERQRRQSEADALLERVTSAREAWRPVLVFFVPSASRGFVHRVCPQGDREKLEASRFNCSGVYSANRLYRTVLVVCDQLPVEPRTLLVRVLFGRRETLVQAWREFEQAHGDTPVYELLLRHAKSYSIYLEGLPHRNSNLEAQRKEYQMVWCMLNYDYYGEKVDQLQDTIQEQARQLEEARSREEEARQLAQAALHSEQEVQRLAEVTASLRAAQERAEMLTLILQDRFTGLNGHVAPLVQYLCTLPLSEALHSAQRSSLAELLAAEAGHA